MIALSCSLGRAGLLLVAGSLTLGFVTASGAESAQASSYCFLPESWQSSIGVVRASSAAALTRNHGVTMFFFEAAFESAQRPDPMEDGRTIIVSHLIVNKHPFATFQEAVSAVSNDHGYPDADMYVIEAQNSREASKIFSTHDPTRVILVRHGRGK